MCAGLILLHMTRNVPIDFLRKLLDQDVLKHYIPHDTHRWASFYSYRVRKTALEPGPGATFPGLCLLNHIIRKTVIVKSLWQVGF